MRHNGRKLDITSANPSVKPALLNPDLQPVHTLEEAVASVGRLCAAFPEDSDASTAEAAAEASPSKKPPPKSK